MALDADRNLLFGILAIQLDFITQDQLIEAANAWMLAKDKTLGEIVVERGFLTSEDQRLLESVVARHLHQSGSVRKSVERLSSLSDALSIDATVQALFSLSGGDESPGSTVPFADHRLHGRRFLLLRNLAQGGLGKVSVARDQELDREVALKEILINRRGSTEARERFISEAKITGGLEHPGIVPIYGLGTSRNGSPFYAMRLIRGRSMQQEIDSIHNGRQGDVQFAELPASGLRTLLLSLIDACNAVAYAHSRGVIHRDLKPSNVMLGKFGETLVVDWGLAKVLENNHDNAEASEPGMQIDENDKGSKTRMGTRLGTTGFMSPEQAAGRTDIVDQRSDCFGLGACLYSIITGQVPYRGSSAEEAARTRDLVKPRELDSSIPKSLEAVCLKAMAKEPQERYATPVELAAEIERWIAGEPVSAMPDPWLHAAWRWARKHQVLVTTCVAFMILGLIGLSVANRAISNQRDRAEVARKGAEASNQVSIEILEEFVERLADDRWSQVPQLETERLEMLQLAANRLEELLKRFPENIGLRLELVSLQLRSANLLRLMGQNEQAKQLMGEVLTTLDLTDSQTAEGDHDRIDRQWIADALNIYCRLIIDSEGNAAAAPYIERELRLRRQILQENAGSEIDQFGLLQCLIFSSEIGLETNQAARSETECVEMIRLGKRLARVELSNSTMKLVVDIFRGHAHCILGSSLASQGKLDKAAEAFQKAIDIQEENLGEYPNQPDVRDFRAKPSVQWARALGMAGRREQAIELATEAWQTYADLVQGSQLMSHKRSAAEVSLLQAMWQFEEGDMQAAVTKVERAKELLEDADSEVFLSGILLLMLDTVCLALGESDIDQSEIVRRLNKLQTEDPHNRQLKMIGQFREYIAR